jgi:hypothetical protein
MIIEMTFDNDGDRIAKVHSSFEQVGKDPVTGLPNNTVIFGTYRPTLSVKEGGNSVFLGVEFTGGGVYFRDLHSGNIRPKQDIKGWKWSIPIRVSFAQIINESPDGIVPQVVRDHLEHFSSDGFAITRLFCDLQSVDLLGVVGGETTTDSSVKPAYQDMFKDFLEGWIAYIKENKDTNPYILGYVLQPPPMSPDVDRDVPDSLKPVGNTFNIFYDQPSPLRSTLNYVINTKTSNLPAGSHNISDVFDSNWLSPDEICDGKLIYSFRAMLESLVLRSLYKTYSESVHEQISAGGISIGTFNTYDKAITRTANGASFDIYNTANNETDQCVTSFDVGWRTTPEGVALEVNGVLNWYKENRKTVQDLIGRNHLARAWAGSESTWRTTISLKLDDNATKPSIQVEASKIENTGGRTWADKNGIADDYNLVGELFKVLVGGGSLLSLFKENGWFVIGTFALSLIKLPKMKTVSGITLDLALEKLSKSLSATIILPAGQTFSFKHMAVRPESGAVSMLVDYR